METLTAPVAPPTVWSAEQEDVLFRAARSVQAWSDAPVPEDVVAGVYDLVRWGPTAMNTSPLRLLLLRSPESRARLAAHLGEGNRARALAAPLTIVVAADIRWHEQMPTLAPHLPDPVATFEPAAEMRERTAFDNAWLQAGYLVVGLRNAGLTVGPMGGMDKAAADADLFADSSWRTVMVLNVGWPAKDDGAHPRAPRLDWETVARTL